MATKSAQKVPKSTCQNGKVRDTKGKASIYAHIIVYRRAERNEFNFFEFNFFFPEGAANSVRSVACGDHGGPGDGQRPVLAGVLGVTLAREASRP